MSAGSPTEQFGPYLVYEQLGVGGMAQVHRAVDANAAFHRPVALKRMLAHIARNEEMVKSFVREARLASYLRHENVAQTYDLGRVGEVYFIVMELVTGRNLREVLRHCAATTGPMPVPIALNILNQVCDALDYAHNLCDETGQPLGIVHRDVSPSNVIVSDSGVVKLIDFGIAKASGGGMQTMSGTLKGKFAYMAPEYLAGQIDARADLFAVGVIAHELLTNRPLFTGRDDIQTLTRVRDMHIDPPSKKNPHVPAEIDDIVMTALARDPDRRWQHATALRTALTTLTRRLGLLASNTQVVQWLDWAFAQAPRRAPRAEHDTQASAPPVEEPSIAIEQLPGGDTSARASDAPATQVRGSTSPPAALAPAAAASPAPGSPSPSAVPAATPAQRASAAELAARHPVLVPRAPSSTTGPVAVQTSGLRARSTSVPPAAGAAAPTADTRPRPRPRSTSDAPTLGPQTAAAPIAQAAPPAATQASTSGLRRPRSSSDAPTLGPHAAPAPHAPQVPAAPRTSTSGLRRAHSISDAPTLGVHAALAPVPQVPQAAATPAPQLEPPAASRPRARSTSDAATLGTPAPAQPRPRSLSSGAPAPASSPIAPPAGRMPAASVAPPSAGHAAPRARSGSAAPPPATAPQTVGSQAIPTPVGPGIHIPMDQGRGRTLVASSAPAPQPAQVPALAGGQGAPGVAHGSQSPTPSIGQGSQARPAPASIALPTTAPGVAMPAPGPGGGLAPGLAAGLAPGLAPGNPGLLPHVPIPPGGSSATAFGVPPAPVLMSSVPITTPGVMPAPAIPGHHTGPFGAPRPSQLSVPAAPPVAPAPASALRSALATVVLVILTAAVVAITVYYTGS